MSYPSSIQKWLKGRIAAEGRMSSNWPWWSEMSASHTASQWPSIISRAHLSHPCKRKAWDEQTNVALGIALGTLVWPQICAQWNLQ